MHADYPGSSAPPSSDRLLTSDRIAEKAMFTKRRRISERLMRNCQKFGSDKVPREFPSVNNMTLPVCKFRNSLSFSTVILLWTFLILSINSSLAFGQHVFSNQFALYIPAGDSKADEIAEKHNCENLGQVSVSFINFESCSSADTYK